ncbi:unnamed protein product, partial [Laminaria digitata]
MGRGAGRGVVIAGGAPRSTLESWNELRRTKAEEIRLHGAMEEAFKALEGVAALRRQDAVGARRDRARETNARADVGHGRACKRARMQAESVAARIEARAREARAVAAAAAAAGDGGGGGGTAGAAATTTTRDRKREQDQERVREREGERFRERDGEQFRERDGERFRQRDGERFREREGERFRERGLEGKSNGWEHVPPPLRPAAAMGDATNWRARERAP